jgi:tetratricopeptide (TPR) repeat protein
MQTHNHDAWTEGHRRLYEHLCRQTRQQPDTIDGLQQLYQAISHGCRAGLLCKAFDDVYRPRIHRWDEFFSTMSLGLFLSELQTTGVFLDQPLAIEVLGSDRVAFLQRQQGYCLRSIGRLSDADDWTRRAYELDKKRNAISDMAKDTASLATLKMIMGDLRAAEEYGRECIKLSYECDSPHQSFYLSTLGSILHYRGEYKEAESTFNKSMKLAKTNDIERERHLATRFYRHCELLLDLRRSEEAAHWAGVILKRLESSLDKHAQGLQYVTLGRAALSGAKQSTENLFQYAEKAVTLLRSGGYQYDLIAALLLKYDANKQLSTQVDPRMDLNEALHIAQRDGMRLMEAECLIRQIDCAPDHATQKQNSRRLKRIIADTGYGRIKRTMNTLVAASNSRSLD